MEALGILQAICCLASTEQERLVALPVSVKVRVTVLRSGRLGHATTPEMTHAVNTGRSTPIITLEDKTLPQGELPNGDMHHWPTFRR
jgi:hypothetical protein